MCKTGNSRSGTMQSFYTAAGARVPTVPASLPAQAAAPVQPAPRPSVTEESSRTAPGNAAQISAASDGQCGTQSKIPQDFMVRSCCFAGGQSDL